MQGQFFKIDSPQDLDRYGPRFLRWMRDNWSQYPACIKVTKYSHPRSIDQNSLYQKWSRQYAAHLLKKTESEVTEEEHEAMKYTLQRHCYKDTAWEFLLGVKRDLFTGEEKPDRARTHNFDTGEMHQFLNWIQAKAADDGLILESLGEYRDMVEAQNA
jgi:hypothetical protein